MATGESYNNSAETFSTSLSRALACVLENSEDGGDHSYLCEQVFCLLFFLVSIANTQARYKWGYRQGISPFSHLSTESLDILLQGWHFKRWVTPHVRRLGNDSLYKHTLQSQPSQTEAEESQVQGQLGLHSEIRLKAK
jgi:hypothetical protein